MGVFRQFPYSNFHEMNMDEIIKIIKNMLEEWATYHAEWDQWMADLEASWTEYQDDVNAQWAAYQNTMNTAWQSMQNFINNYFDNLDVQEEINNKIVSMIQTGEFGLLVNEYIPPAVNAWLNLNITEPTGVVIDTSLSVAGACADAKATGDAIAILNNAFSTGQTSGIPSYRIHITPRISSTNDFVFNRISFPLIGGQRYKFRAKNIQQLENATIRFFILNVDTSAKLFNETIVDEQSTVEAGHVWELTYTPTNNVNVQLGIQRVFLTNEADIECGLVIDELVDVESDITDITNTLNDLIIGNTPTKSILVEKRVNYASVFDVMTDIKVEAGKAYRIYVKNIDALLGATVAIRIRNSANNANYFDEELVTNQSDVDAGHEWTFYFNCKTTDTVKLQIYRTYLTDDATIEAGIVWDETEKLFDTINNETYLVKTVAHRGASITYPENTLIAFKGAKKLGYKYVEMDIRLTSDNVWVVLHDSTINRTARNQDGTEITGDIAIDSITYEQALNYDFGIWKGNQFAGTKIPTFEEALIFCKKVGIIPIFEVKVEFSLTTFNALIALIRKTGMQKNVMALGPQGYLTYFTETDSDIPLMLLTFSFGESVITLADSLKNDYNEVMINTDKSQFTPENIAIMLNSNYVFTSGLYTTKDQILNMPNIISYATTEELNAGEILYEQAMESV